MNAPNPAHPDERCPGLRETAGPAPREVAGIGPAADTGPEPHRLPAGPLTTAELAAAVPAPADRRRYRRIWHGMYRREDQVDDLLLRSRALARSWPEGVLRGRSAALLWGDDSVPGDALPEIWLPATRKSRPGRVYRYGSMPAWAVTQIDGLPVTTPLRTCRDLAADLPLEDAVVSVERLCAVVPELPSQLRAAVDHPAGRGARRFDEVVRAAEPRSSSQVVTRARLLLAAGGSAGFGHGHRVRLAHRSVELPLADPAARCVVFDAAGRPTVGTADLSRHGERLLRAGWTVIVVHTDDGLLHPVGPVLTGGSDRGADSVGGAVVAGAAAAEAAVPRAAQLLRSRWPATEVHLPESGDPRSGPAADPHGMWGGEPH